MTQPAFIEPVWLVEAKYGPNAAEIRPTYRPMHVARIQELKAAGTVIEAGGLLDLTSSYLLIRAESEQAALALCHDDVYWHNGVWTDITARAFGRVI